MPDNVACSRPHPLPPAPLPTHPHAPPLLLQSPELCVEAPELMTVEYLKRRIFKAKLLAGEVGSLGGGRGCRMGRRQAGVLQLEPSHHRPPARLLSCQPAVSPPLALPAAKALQQRQRA